MKVAVWDTYVTRPDGAVTHFDIIVPEEVKDQNIVFDYGKSYLATTGKPEGSLSGQECQLCHIEEPTPEMITQIEAQGYYILEMDDIPGTLPENPSKRDLILHLANPSMISRAFLIRQSRIKHSIHVEPANTSPILSKNKPYLRWLIISICR
jgi:hypothetical protein